MESKQLRYNGIKRRDFIVEDIRDGSIKQFKSYKKFDRYRIKYKEEQGFFNFKAKDFK